MSEEEFKLPQTWDMNLEKMLETPISDIEELTKFKFDWTNQTMNNYSNAPTFIAAINGVRAKKTPNKQDIKGVFSTKEDMVKKMILKPRSPRKPCIIPGAKNFVRQRDKYGVETVVQQRNKRVVLSQLQPLPELEASLDATQRSMASTAYSVRHFTIPLNMLQSY